MSKSIGIKLWKILKLSQGCYHFKYCHRILKARNVSNINFNSHNIKKDMVIVYWNNSKKAWIIPVLQMRDMVLTVIK